VRLGTAALLLAAAALPACESHRAEKMLAEAQRQGASGETAAAAETLRALMRDYPETRAAESARDLLPTYEGLLGVASRNRTRDAEDLLRRTARAVELFKEAHHSLPLSLRVLVPESLETMPMDPWGHELKYEASEDRYALTTFGADGAAGGEGENQDMRIEDGEFVSSPRWLEP